MPKKNEAQREKKQNSRVRVMIADDHTLVREGLRMLLDSQPEFRVVAEAADGITAVRLALEYLPDILLLDARMPEMDGLRALAEIRAHCPDIKVLILSMYDDREIFFQALQLGASGYVLKGATSDELIEALRVGASGQVYLSPRMVTMLVEDFRKGWMHPVMDDGLPLELLSGREQQVLLRLAEGKTNAEIADELVISSSTVQTHRSRILEKLGLRTRSDLVKYALRHGVIRLD